jgi:ElaB/YqjD/DUF883 family membrane-anchored ribosome-binding protein
MSERPNSNAALSEPLARAEADVEQARRRVSSSVLALRDEFRRQADWKGRLSSWNETVAGYIKDRPARCLLGALAVGFVIGKIARRA